MSSNSLASVESIAQQLKIPAWFSPPLPLTDKLWIHPKAQRLATQVTNTMVVLNDDSLLTTLGDEACVSKDDGLTWTRYPLFTKPGPQPRFEQALIRCSNGAVVCVYEDNATRQWGWDNDKHEPTVTPRLETFSIRSSDGGKTWTSPVKIIDQCGCIIHGIQTRSGRLIVPIQHHLLNPFRNTQMSYVSDDLGDTWKPSNVIDIGGHGHHDGGIEASIVELRDGRIWMLLRTNLDRFWQAFSEDQGESWRTIYPTEIGASSAPAWVQRLNSGRLIMAWNRLYAQNLSPSELDEWIKGGGRFGADLNTCKPLSSWHRNELSIAFSEDDGKTWREPVVIARDQRLAYPTILERRPGEIWVATRFSQRVGLRFSEKDFV